MKLFYIILLVFINTFFTAKAVEESVCNHDFNYTKGSTFESNLKRVFKNLVQHTSQTGFNTCVYGQTYGLLQCMGDTTVDECHNCSQEATTRIRQDCGNAGGGAIWLDACSLRYENYSFFGQLDIVDAVYLYNLNNVSTPDVFNAAVESLFANLSAEATSGSKLYASGITTDSLSRRIYGVVQCWRDISSKNCKACLSYAINSILSSFSGKAGARALIGSCTARYEIYPFFNSILPPSPSPADAPAITPAKQITKSRAITPLAYAPGSKRIPESINESHKKSSNRIIMILGVIGSWLLV